MSVFVYIVLGWPVWICSYIIGHAIKTGRPVWAVKSDSEIRLHWWCLYFPIMLVITLIRYSTCGWSAFIRSFKPIGPRQLPTAKVVTKRNGFRR